MSDFIFNYSNLDEARHALETLLSRLPEQGCVKLQVDETPVGATRSLSSLWEEMGSQTGALIGRAIGTGSEITALGLQGLFLTGNSAIRGAIPSDADSDQELGVHPEQPPETSQPGQIRRP